MTVPVVAIFFANPGQEQKVEELFRAVVPTTRAEEGCISYQLNRDTANSSCFIFTEEWESRELLEKHFAAPHIVELFRVLPPHIASSQVSILGKLA